MNIVLFIDSLRIGGAQWQFAQLAEGLTQRGHQVTFATIHGGGPYWDWLSERGNVRLQGLYQERGITMAHRVVQLLSAPRRLAALLREREADVVYSALHTSDFIAWLAGQRRCGLPVAWSLRASKQAVPWKQRVSVELCRLASGKLPLILANSHAGLEAYQKRGFQPRQTAVIPNGIDVDIFRPDAKAGQAVRKAWGVGGDAPVLGSIGRLMPVKNHALFLDAAARLAAKRPEARFVCVGSGPSGYTRQLQEQADALKLKDKVIWAGARHDMRAVYNALDLLCLSSRSEGFPNVVAEAMACGVPPVATQVGDVGLMIGETGKTVHAATPNALAEALFDLASLPSTARLDLGQKARTRIVERFSMEAMVRHTEAHLESLCLGRPSAGPEALMPDPAA
ncbi:MAG: glycosyltransferase [Geminicoccaceae bacterium]